MKRKAEVKTSNDYVKQLRQETKISLITVKTFRSRISAIHFPAGARRDLSALLG